jgi:hypothetical protein
MVGVTSVSAFISPNHYPPLVLILFHSWPTMIHPNLSEPPYPQLALPSLLHPYQPSYHSAHIQNFIPQMPIHFWLFPTIPASSEPLYPGLALRSLGLSSLTSDSWYSELLFSYLYSYPYVSDILTVPLLLYLRILTPRTILAIVPLFILTYPFISTRLCPPLRTLWTCSINTRISLWYTLVRISNQIRPLNSSLLD